MKSLSVISLAIVHVIQPGAGPDGATLKAPDTETPDAFIRSLQRS
jgi:hypothetical protein